MDRKGMARTLEEGMAKGYAHLKGTGRLPRGRNPLKSYLIEANAPEVGEYRDGVRRFFGGSDLPVSVEVVETDDPTIHQIRIGGNRIEFFLDTFDVRFWLLHSTASADEADGAIRSLVHRTPFLDSVWLPSRQFETWAGRLGTPRVMTAKFSMPTGGLYREDLPDEEFLDNSLLFRIGATGDARPRWKDYRESPALAPSLALWSARIARREEDRDLIVVDDVTAVGKATSRGNSFRLHQELLHTLKNLYSDLIVGWESKHRLGWTRNGSSLHPTGSTAVVRLPAPLMEQEIEDLLRKLFNCGEPYRLYGVPVRQSGLRYVAKGVDLHTGDKIDFEMTPDFLRIYLYPSTCGNVLARLLTNLQHYHDARVDLE